MGIDVYVKTLKSDGIQGLYRGFAISAVGIFVYRGLYFGLYDTLKPLLLGADAGVFVSFLLGWVITVSAGLASYPITLALWSSSNNTYLALWRNPNVDLYVYYVGRPRRLVLCPAASCPSSTL